MSPIRYSRGASSSDNTPVQREAATADEFFNALLDDYVQATGSAAKDRQYICAPAAPAPDDKLHRSHEAFSRAIGKPHRCKSCALPRRWLGFDIDEGLTPESMSALTQIAQAMSAMVWTTASHTPEAPRLRILVVLDEEAGRHQSISASKAMRARFDRELSARSLPPVKWDTSVDRPEQPVFLMPEDSEVFLNTGSAVSLRELLTEVPEETPEPKAAKTPRSTREPGAELLPSVQRALAELATKVETAPPGERNNALNEAAWAAAQLYQAAPEEIEAALLPAAERAGLRRNESVATVHSGLRGGGQLDERIPPEVDFADLALAPEDNDRDPEWPKCRIEPAASPCADLANANRLVRNYGPEMLFARQIGWYRWTSSRWERGDAIPIAMKIGKLVAAEAKFLEAEADAAAARSDNTLDAVLKANEALNSDKLRKAAKERVAWARVSETFNGMKNTLSVSESMLGVNAESLDQTEHCIGTSDGKLVDLRTGESRKQIQGDLITRSVATSYRSTATCPLWERVISEVFLGDAELIEWFQRFVGYCMTGSTKEQLFVAAHGIGSNGKSTVFSTLLDMMGAYGAVAPQSLLAENDNGSHPTQFMQLRGARFVLASETREQDKLSEATVKWITGGDKISGRYMGKDFVEFDPTHKIVLQTNHKPAIYGQDEGIWRRVRLVPFRARFSDAQKDPTIPERLRAETEGIFAWAVRGAVKWYAGGLPACAVIDAAGAEYRKESDTLGQFLDECCMLGAEHTENASDLYRSYKAWASDGNLRIWSKRTFGTKLSDKGFAASRTAASRRWRGIKLCAVGLRSTDGDFGDLAATGKEHRNG